jgi:multisubunit Na+/H+ antiporter MnhF subunit
VYSLVYNNNLQKMDPLLLRILVIMNVLLAISTVVNVIHKLTIINGPNAHIAIAILSLLVLFGYSGVLNTMFLKRRFHLGRRLYLAVAGLSQITILILSFLSYYGVMTYFDAIAIIHALMGFITILNFTCTVLVVDEQQK